MEEFLGSVVAQLPLLTAIGATISFVVGLSQYAKAQAWQRAHFVAEEIAKMKQEGRVQLALMLLDWHARRCPIGENGKEVVVTHRHVASALRPHDSSSSFEPHEVRIREAFDAFFDSLERFQQFIESGLVAPQAFTPYLRYYFQLMVRTAEPGAGSAKQDLPAAMPAAEEHLRDASELSRALATYLDTYGFSAASALMRNSGFPPLNSKSGSSQTDTTKGSAHG